jgi:hypothetical protein
MEKLNYRFWKFIFSVCEDNSLLNNEGTQMKSKVEDNTLVVDDKWKKFIDEFMER